MQDTFQLIPALISCAGVTGSVRITRHSRATQMAGLRSSQSHSLAAYGSAHLLQLRLHLQSNCRYPMYGTQAVRADSAHAHTCTFIFTVPFTLPPVEFCCESSTGSVDPQNGQALPWGQALPTYPLLTCMSPGQGLGRVQSLDSCDNTYSK